MAVIHISEADAAKDFAGLMAKARAGEEIYIEGDAVPLRLTRASSVPENSDVPRFTQPRLISDVLADLRARGSKAVPPAGFAEAVEEGIRTHEHERLSDAWE